MQSRPRLHAEFDLTITRNLPRGIATAPLLIPIESLC